MDKWLGRAPAAPTPTKAKKPAASTTALPTDCHDWTLPDALEKRLAMQTPTVLKRIAWPIAGRLGFGSSFMDRGEPTQLIKDMSVRVIVDVTHGELRDQKRYASAVADANAVLVHLPLNSKHKMQEKSVQGYLSVCRTLHRVLQAARQGDGEPPFAMYVCDSRGGGVAALVVEMLVALELHCSLADACVYVTRTWNTNLPEGAQPQRMFPEGEVLKAAISMLYGRLRDQPLATTAVASAADAVAAVFKTHRVPNTGRAALHLLELDASVTLSKAPFSRTAPMQVVVWLRKNDPLPPKPEPRESGWSERPKRRWRHRDDDGSESDSDDDDSDDGPRRRQWNRRHRRQWNDSDSD